MQSLAAETKNKAMLWIVQEDGAVPGKVQKFPEGVRCGGRLSVGGLGE